MTVVTYQCALSMVVAPGTTLTLERQQASGHTFTELYRRTHVELTKRKQSLTYFVHTDMSMNTSEAGMRESYASPPDVS
jgi:hypothetical protein